MKAYVPFAPGAAVELDEPVDSRGFSTIGSNRHRSRGSGGRACAAAGQAQAAYGHLTCDVSMLTDLGRIDEASYGGITSGLGFRQFRPPGRLCPHSSVGLRLTGARSSGERSIHNGPNVGGNYYCRSRVRHARRFDLGQPVYIPVFAGALRDEHRHPPWRIRRGFCGLWMVPPAVHSSVRIDCESDLLAWAKVVTAIPLGRTKSRGWPQKNCLRPTASYSVHKYTY